MPGVMFHDFVQICFKDFAMIRSRVEDDFEMDNDGGMKTEFTFDLNVQGASKDKNIDLELYEEQKKRVAAVKNVIQLETEGFELMSVNSATLYQNYVAK